MTHLILTYFDSNNNLTLFSPSFVILNMNCLMSLQPQKYVNMNCTIFNDVYNDV